jgi:hypothetical protein
MKRNWFLIFLWLVCFNFSFMQLFSATSEAQDYCSSIEGIVIQNSAASLISVESCPVGYPIACTGAYCCPDNTVCVGNMGCCPSSFPVYCGNDLCAASASDCPASSICPLSMVLGEDNPKLENLRSFRDNTLAKSAVGRKVIQIYYNNAESINAAFDRSPALRKATRQLFEVIAPMVGNKKD